MLNNSPLPSGYEEAAGPIGLSLTNDWLFHLLLQRNKKVLTSLISSLLHMDPDDIASADIINPILPGEHVSDKTFFLDILITLNNNMLIHMEMQVINEHNWPDRSLCYLCREFDHIHSGEDYSSLRPVIQIGFLDFTLFPENPEFYATYYVMNEKNHQKYSDKFRISVVDLSKIELATEEDKAHKIDQWAALFKAATWEELKAMAENNDSIQSAVHTIYTLTADEKLRRELDERERWIKKQKREQMEKEQNLAKISQLTSEVEQLNSELEKYKSILLKNGLL